MKQLSETEGKKILGVAGTNVRNGNLYADEFLHELRDVLPKNQRIGLTD